MRGQKYVLDISSFCDGITWKQQPKYTAAEFLLYERAADLEYSIPLVGLMKKVIILMMIDLHK